MTRGARIKNRSDECHLGRTVALAVLGVSGGDGPFEHGIICRFGRVRPQGITKRNLLVPAQAVGRSRALKYS